MMDGVREYGDSEPVELWLEENCKRPVIRALNEACFASTEVDLLDVLTWVEKRFPGAVDLEAVTSALRNDFCRYVEVD
jgi:hypothetical protein